MSKIILMFFLFVFPALASETAEIGSKADTESRILGEIAAQSLQDAGVHVTKHLGIGGTGLVLEAIQRKSIDVYPEYTGTITREILKTGEMNWQELSHALAPMGLVITSPLGFENSYALAVKQEFADRYHLRTLSDLAKVSAFAQVALSEEFAHRPDGWLGLALAYQLHFSKPERTMAHSLLYEAIADGRADVVDIYTTDAKIGKFGLMVLQDDRHFFPSYQAVYLAHKEFVERSPKAWALLEKSAGTLSAQEMIRLNAKVDVDHQDAAQAVAEFRGHHGTATDLTGEVLLRTREHFSLVGTALLLSVLLGVPLGILAARQAAFGQFILLLSGILQTIPSLAMLCFLIPIFGIGFKPSLTALCLYGLLPVILSTFTGLRSIDPNFIEIARALGLSRWNRMIRIELPLASRNILAGIRTSLVIGIGTATLAALIGGGGYGVPIMVGLSTNNLSQILMGAVPAAAMALVAHLLFQGLDWLLIPRGLNLPRAN